MNLKKKNFMYKGFQEVYLKYKDKKQPKYRTTILKNQCEAKIAERMLSETRILIRIKHGKEKSLRFVWVWKTLKGKTKKGKLENQGNPKSVEYI